MHLCITADAHPGKIIPGGRDSVSAIQWYSFSVALTDDQWSWKNDIIDQVREEIASFETSMEVGLKAFFLSILAKIRAEDTTRKTIRRKIEPRLSELIDKINLITADIKGKEGSAGFNR